MAGTARRPRRGCGRRTGWRTSAVGHDRATGCPFCRIPTGDDEDSLVVARGEATYAVLNLHPYNPGHLMVLPYRHVADLEDLTAESRAS